MQTSLNDFDYHLPHDRIAQSSIEPRDAAKLLIVEPHTLNLTDKHVSDLPSLLRKGDVLVYNDSKVFKARLEGTLSDGSPAECFLLHPLEGTHWEALIQPGKKLQPGSTIHFGDTVFSLVEKTLQGTAIVETSKITEDVFAFAETHGSIPIPPYVEKNERNQSGYQTTYAKHTGSVAAPTAGFHFTDSLLEKLREQGVEICFVTLHVGLGTFRPIKTTTIEEHQMHSEWGHVPKDTAHVIKKAKSEGRRVIAVGTTATRALESWSLREDEWSGFTDIFITPGYTFRVIDGLMTNFHLPKSTLIVLVSALAGRETILHAYEHAIKNDYRFYSFGDAMLITSN